MCTTRRAGSLDGNSGLVRTYARALDSFIAELHPIEHMQSRCSGSLNTPVPSTSYGEQVHKAVLKQATSVCGHRRRRGRSRALQCSAILGLFR